MWQLIVGYVAGGASALIFVHVMNKKLMEQRAQYERQFEGSNRRISDLTCKDAYRQGRDYESDAQRRYRAELRQQIDTLTADNEELRRELNLESVFANRVKTQGKATMFVR